MELEPLGDAAWIVRGLEEPAYAVAEALRALALGVVVDVVASYDTIGVYCKPGALSAEALEGIIAGLASVELPEPKRHRIPVCYEMGADQQEVCRSLGLSAEDLAVEHTSVEYQCFAVGFCPGFGYLGWLPERLQGVPRRQSPRTRTEAGSVGITGKQTGVYPLQVPGGWPIIARTPLTLVDVEDRYFPISAGDRVSFYAIDAEEFGRMKGERL